jgi:hypothetical protein
MMNFSASLFVGTSNGGDHRLDAVGTHSSLPWPTRAVQPAPCKVEYLNALRTTPRSPFVTGRSPSLSAFPALACTGGARDKLRLRFVLPQPLRVAPKTLPVPCARQFLSALPALTRLRCDLALARTLNGRRHRTLNWGYRGVTYMGAWKLFRNADGASDRRHSRSTAQWLREGSAGKGGLNRRSGPAGRCPGSLLIAEH